MEKVTLDKNYNVVVSSRDLVYQDHLFDTAEEIKRSLDAKEITPMVANMLFYILINKEAKKEAAGLAGWLSQGNKEERTSLFIKISNNHKKYA